MIGQDGARTTIDGNINTIISEASSLMHHICKDIEKNTDSPYERVLDQITSSMQIYNLVDAGMTPEEALEVTGMKGKIKRIDVTNEDGTKYSIDGDCHVK